MPGDVHIPASTNGTYAVIDNKASVESVNQLRSAVRKTIKTLTIFWVWPTAAIAITALVIAIVK